MKSSLHGKDPHGCPVTTNTMRQSVARQRLMRVLVVLYNSWLYFSRFLSLCYQVISTLNFVVPSLNSVTQAKDISSLAIKPDISLPRLLTSFCSQRWI